MDFSSPLNTLYSSPDRFEYAIEQCTVFITHTRDYTTQFDKHLYATGNHVYQAGQYLLAKLGSEKPRDFWVAIAAIALISLFIATAMVPLFGVCVAVGGVRLALFIAEPAAQGAIVMIQLIASLYPQTSLRSYKCRENDLQKVQELRTTVFEKIPKVETLSFSVRSETNRTAELIQNCHKAIIAIAQFTSQGLDGALVQRTDGLTMAEA